MSASSSWSIIDFHTHLRPPEWAASPAGIETLQTRPEVGRKLSDPQALADDSRDGDVRLSVISSTVEGLFGTSGPTDIGRIRALNDYLAETQARFPGLAALATVDAYAGEEAAIEAERAITKLGHIGIVVDSARDDRLLADPSARAVLELANSLKVPVFVHPVSAPHADVLTRQGGRAANSAGRGLSNGAAFLSLLTNDVLASLPNLNVVFTALAAGALVSAANHTKQYKLDARAVSPRPNIYFDVMGLDPAVTRFFVDFLGAERVIVGSDWPLHPTPSRARLDVLFERVGLTEAQKALIASGNVERLLARTDLA